MHRHRLLPSSLRLAAVFFLFAGLCPSIGRAAEPAQARLAVVVVFDQMRGDYLTRWHRLFGKDGFHRLERDGAWFDHCHYPYAHTVTAAGHTSVLAGCSPMTHGIIGNSWYDRAAGAVVGCVRVKHYDVVPAAKEARAGRATAPGVSPEWLLVPTLGDVLKKETAGRGRVVSLSLKDRSAVLPAGRHPDACYWLDGSTGTFVTSTYYRDRPHPWVADFNRERVADRWFGKTWDRLRPDVDNTDLSGPDDAPGEGSGNRQGRTFPHPLTGGLKAPGRAYYGALMNSPFGNDLLLALVEQAIDAERLGSRDVPDLLCISFSSNDPIGHCWGPDSQEVMDVTLRSDLIVRDLLAHLDAKVGRGRYVLALTADHGVCPLPEFHRAHGGHAVRVSVKALAGKANAFLNQKLANGVDKARWIENLGDPYPWLYVNRKLLKQHSLQAGRVEDALAGWLRQQPDVQAAYTRAQLMRGPIRGDAIGERVRKSFYPERSGDIAYVLKPYDLPSSQPTGTTHGSPHAYDTHVPLLASGPGIRHGRYAEAVTPQAIAAILARSLGMPPPARADVSVPESLR
jgi:predicted AlkP superfamily pyrophosphatase or phosphodiesterase